MDFALDWDYCASVPCLNGGKCKNRATGFSCSCPNGYSGSYCQDESELNETCYYLFNFSNSTKNRELFLLNEEN